MLAYFDGDIRYSHRVESTGKFGAPSSDLLVVNPGKLITVINFVFKLHQYYLLSLNVSTYVLICNFTKHLHVSYIHYMPLGVISLLTTAQYKYL